MNNDGATLGMDIRFHVRTRLRPVLDCNSYGTAQRLLPVVSVWARALPALGVRPLSDLELLGLLSCAMRGGTLYVYVYMYVCIYVYVYIHMPIYT